MRIEKTGSLFTIGHSQHSMEHFTELLKLHEIEYLVDVRSVPYSRYAEQFNREALRNALKFRGIQYGFMGRWLGAKPENPQLYSITGQLDFERVRTSEKFCQGIDRILSGLAKGFHVALMCVEKDPFDCHRAILAARAFELRGTEAKHILSDGTIQTQQTLNGRLLDHYFPNRAQVTLFEDSSTASSQDLLCEAYRKRNQDIGYIRR